MVSKIVLPKLSSRSSSVFLGGLLGSVSLCRPDRVRDGGKSEAQEDGSDFFGDHGNFPPNLRRQHPYITNSSNGIGWDDYRGSAKFSGLGEKWGWDEVAW